MYFVTHITYELTDRDRPLEYSTLTYRMDELKISRQHVPTLMNDDLCTTHCEVQRGQERGIQYTVKKASYYCPVALVPVPRANVVAAARVPSNVTYPR